MSTAKNLPFGRRLQFAAAGLRHGLASERSLRAHAVALTGLLVLLVLLRPPAVWWGLTLTAGGFVVSAELMNTALEQLADHVAPEVHARIGVANDSAAAGVLVAAVTAVAVLCAMFAARFAAR